MIKLTLQEALEQGFKHYSREGYEDDIRELKWIHPNGDRLDNDAAYHLYSKEPNHPCVDGQQLFDVISEHLQDNSEFYDEQNHMTDAISDAKIDWEEIAGKINKEFEKITYYSTTDIILIP